MSQQPGPIHPNQRIDVAAASEGGNIDTNPASYPQYKIFSATGEELFRHEGFFSREDILAKWRDLGVEIEAI